MPLSLRDTAFALDDTSGSWSLRDTAGKPTWPRVVPEDGPISVRAIAKRFSRPGGELRSFAQSSKNCWDHLDRDRIVEEIRSRLRNPLIMEQSPTGLCGPLSIVMELARRRPTRYVRAARELLEDGRLTCPTGRVITAEKELRQEPYIGGAIGQVDWLLAASMRDDANIWEDVDDDANGLESITMWDEQRSWTVDVLDLPDGGWETTWSWGEIDCMRWAQNAVNAGGVAFFLIDKQLLKHEGDAGEELIEFRRRDHNARHPPDEFSGWERSMDDRVPIFPSNELELEWGPPDHWIVYLGGFDLGSNPQDDDMIDIRVWSWGAEYRVRGTAEAFGEYLYATVVGTS